MTLVEVVTAERYMSASIAIGSLKIQNSNGVDLTDAESAATEPTASIQSTVC